MRRGLWVAGLVTLVCAFSAMAQDKPGPAEAQRPQGDPARGLEMRKQALEIEARESEIQFRRQMQEVELQKQRMEIEKQKQGWGQPGQWPQGKRCHGGAALHGLLAMLMVVCTVVHVLLTVWVYQDIRKRNAGSSLWIAITLLTGIPGALIYVLTRLGDNRQQG